MERSWSLLGRSWGDRVPSWALRVRRARAHVHVHAHAHVHAHVHVHVHVTHLGRVGPQSRRRGCTTRRGTAPASTPPRTPPRRERRRVDLRSNRRAWRCATRGRSAADRLGPVRPAAAAGWLSRRARRALQRRRSVACDAARRVRRRAPAAWAPCLACKGARLALSKPEQALAPRPQGLLRLLLGNQWAQNLKGGEGLAQSKPEQASGRALGVRMGLLRASQSKPLGVRRKVCSGCS